MKQREIGELFSVDYSAVSQNRRQLKHKLEVSPDLQTTFEDLAEKLDSLSIQKI
jgi:hypothetical protein